MAGPDRTLTLTTANTAGLEANIFGTLVVGLDNNQTGASGNFTKGGANAIINFNANSTYEHARNGGTIPASMWDPTSICIVNGITTTETLGKDQSFGNFTWNCTGQSVEISIWELADAGSVAGDFTVASTGSGYIRISDSSTPTLSIGGDLNMAGGNFYLTIGAGTPSIDVGGNLNITSGQLNMSSGTGTTSIYVNGDFSLTGGTLTETGGGRGAINFAGSALQTYFRSGGNITNNIDFSIFSGSLLDVGTSTFVGSGNFSS
ncbi:MAG: hypothetical protein MZV63_07475 [Marinilabiliales bacterium]|nr:hypothetical protein [Marinilabiliales bacterium]